MTQNTEQTRVVTLQPEHELRLEIESNCTLKVDLLFVQISHLSIRLYHFILCYNHFFVLLAAFEGQSRGLWVRTGKGHRIHSLQAEDSRLFVAWLRTVADGTFTGRIHCWRYPNACVFERTSRDSPAETASKSKRLCRPSRHDSRPC